MRILHINCNYIGTKLHQLMIKELDEHNIENRVFVPTYYKQLSTLEPQDDVYVSECFSKYDKLFFDYKQKKIIQAIEEHYDVSRFDLIHAYTLFTDGNVARILSAKYKIPYVVAVRNTDLNYFFKYMIYLRDRGVNNLVCASKICFLSESYKTTLFDKYINSAIKDILLAKSIVIPNGIDKFWHENLFYQKTYTDIKQRIADREIKLIYVGGIDKNKNILTTCKSLDILKKKGWTIEFTVAGPIKEKKVYEKIKDHINYIGVLPKEELIGYYRQADIFVMPSYSETFGLVYAEAMSQGLPVVYSIGQGFDQQFEEGKVGFHVNANSANDCAMAIEHIVNKYENISRACLNEVKKFNWKVICDTYVNVYNKVVSQGRNTYEKSLHCL